MHLFCHQQQSLLFLVDDWSCCCCALQPLPFKADMLRGVTVFAAMIGFITYNLPPLAVAPRLWHRVADVVG
jgi:hypothetical protein